MFFMHVAEIVKIMPNFTEKKKEIRPSPMTKTFLPTKNQKPIDNTQKPIEKFDYSMIADRLRTVSWSDSSHPTGVVNPGLKGNNLPSHRKSSVIDRTWHDRKYCL